MPVSFECKAEAGICERVEGNIKMLLERAGFGGEANIRVVIGRPEGCVGPCIVYDLSSEEEMATFNALASIFTFALGDYLSRRGAACKYWLVDGLAAALASRVVEEVFPGFTGRLEGRATGLVGEDQLEERFGTLMLAGPGMVTPSGGKGPGDAVKAAAAALEYLNNQAFRASAVKAVRARLKRDPSSWSEAVQAAEVLCKA